MLSRMKHESAYVREQQPRKALLWYAVVFTLLGLVLTTIMWLLVSAWKRPTDVSLFERPLQTVASSPMQVGPLITGKDKATVGELVYLRRVLLKAGPAPKMFFLTGSKGAQILTVTEGAHVIASPGNRVDVQGTIHSTPSVATLRKQWKVSLADAKRISETPIYIQCEFIRENGHDNAFREEHP
jgi:hypothetical protein